MTDQISAAEFRALTEDELCSALNKYCARQIGDILDLRLKKSAAGDHLAGEAVDDIAQLLFDNTGPLTLELIGLSSGLSIEKLQAMSIVDRMIALLQTFEVTFENTSVDDLGERVLVRLFGAGAQTSAVIAGSERH
ncbi:MAG: hypothetical protein P0Y65_13790 [Candidatus Devosia phytovorans]|uniref:Uncharacterized protein n=1 Tax=Candidatus Devosia phytovorans TaxID=3121372 RepID=A0AAJ6B086_9HYPH|nr:hypothetical protein [Devosia sp.]WEK03263.1 MAG: hypothetical protein P0Y65_13790 [Devosia sp.]